MSDYYYLKYLPESCSLVSSNLRKTMFYSDNVQFNIYPQCFQMVFGIIPSSSMKGQTYCVEEAASCFERLLFGALV